MYKRQALGTAGARVYRTVQGREVSYSAMFDDDIRLPLGGDVVVASGLSPFDPVASKFSCPFSLKSLFPENSYPSRYEVRGRGFISRLFDSCACSWNRYLRGCSIFWGGLGLECRFRQPMLVPDRSSKNDV